MKDFLKNYPKILLHLKYHDDFLNKKDLAFQYSIFSNKGRGILDYLRSRENLIKNFYYDESGHQLYGFIPSHYNYEDKYFFDFYAKSPFVELGKIPSFISKYFVNKEVIKNLLNTTKFYCYDIFGGFAPLILDIDFLNSYIEKIIIDYNNRECDYLTQSLCILLSNQYVKIEILTSLFDKSFPFSKCTEDLYLFLVLAACSNPILQSNSSDIMGWDFLDNYPQDIISNILNKAWNLFAFLEVNNKNAALLAEIGQKLERSNACETLTLDNTIRDRWQEPKIKQVYRDYIEYALIRLKDRANVSYINSPRRIERAFHYSNENYDLNEAMVFFKKDGELFVRHCLENKMFERSENEELFDLVWSQSKKITHNENYFIAIEENLEGILIMEDWLKKAYEDFFSFCIDNYNYRARLKKILYQNEDMQKNTKLPLYEIDESVNKFINCHLWYEKEANNFTNNILRSFYHANKAAKQHINFANNLIIKQRSERILDNLFFNNRLSLVCFLLIIIILLFVK